MTKQIKNPYVVSFSKYANGWTVMFRYMINDKIKFKVISTSTEKAHAEMIARALNRVKESSDA